MEEKVNKLIEDSGIITHCKVIDILKKRVGIFQLAPIIMITSPIQLKR